MTTERCGLFRPGIVSVTFRQLSPQDIATRAASSGLKCVEWGGDIHVPQGDLKRAREVRMISADHGLAISAYGSYLKLGLAEHSSAESVVETANVLGAPLIRVWAGATGSADASSPDREKVVHGAIELAGIAARHGISIAYEFHSNTLTDTIDSARELLARTALPNIFTLWQPPNGWEENQALESLEAVLPRLANLHVFHWWPDSSTRLLLREGAERWLNYLKAARPLTGHRDVLLEFLPGNDPALLPGEAAELSRLIAQATTP